MRGTVFIRRDNDGFGEVYSPRADRAESVFVAVEAWLKANPIQVGGVAVQAVRGETSGTNAPTCYLKPPLRGRTGLEKVRSMAVMLCERTCKRVVLVDDREIARDIGGVIETIQAPAAVTEHAPASLEQLRTADQEDV